MPGFLGLEGSARTKDDSTVDKEVDGTARLGRSVGDAAWRSSPEPVTNAKLVLDPDPHGFPDVARLGSKSYRFPVLC